MSPFRPATCGPVTCCLVALGLLTGCAPQGLHPTAKPVKITDVGAILGSYSMRGTNPDDIGGSYMGTVTIRDNGSGGLQVTQLIQGDSWFGDANIDSEGRLHVVFEASNVEGTWTLLEDGQFKGTWNERGRSGGGVEVWSP